MSVTIRSVFGRELFVAESAQDVRSAVREALAAKADLSYANLSYANLRYANLRYANLRYANLRYANPILSLAGLPSGHAIFWPTPQGWAVRVGCWTGTLPEFREMIAGTDWPESRGAEILIRRPGLELFAALCDNHATRNQKYLDEVVAKWAPKAVSE